MKLELEVLVSSSIKRKKPWPKLAFIGEAEGSVFLLDRNRISVLYLPSGKTKKKIPKLHSLVSESISITHSNNGHFILGLMLSGDLFLWHKDTDLLRFIPGISDLTKCIQSHRPMQAASQSSCLDSLSQTFHLFLADDGCRIIVVIDACQIYVWELDQGCDMFHSSANSLKGSWSKVLPPTGIILPDPHNIEASLDAVFMINEAVNGLCCELSFVFNHQQSVCVTSLILMWYDVQNVFTHRQPTFHAHWNIITYPLDLVIAKGQPIRVPGAYVSSQSHDGNLLAVAVNQLDTYKNRMMFVSPWTDAVVVVDMKGMGTKEPITANARSHWVSDMRWTADDLFVVCVTLQGSLCILTRLGVPLMLQSHGCNIEMGPKPFLPLHPLISVRTEEDDCFPQTEAAAFVAYQQDVADPLHQRFSIAVHPRLPLILVSDGFMVTAIQLPANITCLTMIKGLVKESSHHLSKIRDQKKIKLTLFDRHKLLHRIGLQPGKPEEEFYKKASSNSCASKYVFEEDEGDTGLDTTQDSDIADFILAGELKIGKITFGDVENLNATIDFAHFLQDDSLSVGEHMIRAHKAITMAWSLAASHIGLWTADHEEACHHIAHNTMHLFACLMHADSKTLRQLDQACVNMAKTSKSRGKKKPLQKILGLFRQMTRLLYLDATSHHMMVCAFGFVRSFVDFLLKNNTVVKKHGGLQSLGCCYTLLRYCDALFSRVYKLLPVSSYHGALSVASPNTPSHDLYAASFLTELVPTKKLSLLAEQVSKYTDKQQVAADVDDDGYSSQLSARSAQESSEKTAVVGFTIEKQSRLLPLWKLLYKKTVQHYQKLARQCVDAEEEDVLHKDLEKTLTLVKLLQHVIQQLGGKITQTHRHQLTQGDKLYIEGSLDAAVDSWIHFIEDMSDDKLQGPLGSRVFHSLFYALILSDQLRKAILLVKSVIWQGDLKTSVSVCKENKEDNIAPLAGLQQKFENLGASYPDSVIKRKPARQLLQTLGRLMAIYFSNGSMFVYPPHAPKQLPAIHLKQTSQKRVVPLCRNNLTTLIRRDKLDDVWTPECALECLMMSGLYTEAIWFVDQLQDWKTAFIMSVAANMHRDLAPELYKSHRLLLTEELTPERILKSHLHSAFFSSDSASGKDVHLHIDEATDFDQLTSVLHDILLTAVVCKVELVTPLLQELLSKLKSLASKFTVLVPEGLYLPAPPVYCPQPAQTVQEGLSAEARDEMELRKQVSSVFHLMLLVLNSSGVGWPAAMWYAQKVLEAVEKGTKLWKTAFSKSSLDIKILQETFLREASRFAGEESTPAVQTVLSSFRELCSLTWMLYVRDKLSLCLRDKAKMAEKKLRKSITEEEWLAHCELTLKWTKQLLPFSVYLSGNSDIHGILLSLILELPHSADTAKLMAEYFSHPETMAPEIQDKLQWILKEWQGVFLKSTNTWKLVDREGRTKVESPHGVTMSLFFNSNLDRADRMMKKRRKLFGFCEDQVFVGEMLRQKKLLVGSRYFESTQEYLEFLDVLYAVSFHRLMDSGQEKPSTSHPDQPLLVQYSKLHKEIELGSTSHEVKRSEKMFRGGNTVAMTPSPKPVIQLSSGVDVDDLTSGVSPQQHRAKGLLSHGKLKTKTDAVKSGSSKPRAVNGSGSDDGDRSLHMSDLDDDTTANKTKQVAARDPLLPPLMPGKMLDGTRLDKRFTRVEQLLDWLSVWAGRNHTLLAHNTTSGSSSTSAIRVRVSPRMIMYSLWLLENCYNPPPSVTAATAARPEHFGEITVATVCCHSPKDSNPEEQRESTTRTGKDDGTDPRKSKKKKNKKKKKKSEVRGKPEGDILPQSSGDTPDVRTDEESWKSTSILLNSEADKHVATESMKSDQSKLFSINEADSTEAQSEMTLTFSSLRDEDLKQTIKETVSKMSQSIHYGEQDGDFTSHHTSLNAAMNNTLRFRDTDQSKRGQRSPQQRQPSPEDYTRARQSASQQSDVSTVAQELQGIVRQELRKIMEAQHKGILAMLGALDDNDDGANDLQSRMTTKSSVTTTPHKQSIRATPQRGLTLSQLADGRELATSEAESGLGQALRQMRLLEGDQRAITQQGGHAPSRSQPGASGARQELYEIDLDLPGQHPRLLHIPSKQPNQGLHLPNIPQQAWSEKSTPLLHTDHRLQDIPERDITTDIQMSKGQTSVLNSLPFPLLTLNQSSVGRGSFTGDKPRIPSLIPPEEILLYEERKYKTNVLKAREVFEFVNEQMANQMAAQKQPEPLGKKLLKPDVFEPFGPLDERDKKQREKHRGKKLTNNNTQSRQKTLSKEKLDVEDRSTEDTLHSLTESELRSEMADYVKESDRKGKQHKRSREENKTHENAQLGDDVPINHGYALTPGLFDEYLKNQDELGSAIETNARIQYRAATGVQTTPRTQKDACTETSLADKERAMALSAGTDPVSDAIKKYYEAKTGHTSTILSPDVFLALRFDGTSNAPEANGSQPSRAFLNVVDINADILDEIASTARERESSKQVAQRTEFTLPSQRIAAAAAHREQSSVVLHPERDYVEGGDHTTARLLGRSASPVDPITAEAVMYTSRRQRTRDDIRKKLENMNMQFNAIDSMNTSIEREFKDSELILHTIEKMAESLVPEKTVSPSRQQQEQQQQQDWQTAEHDVTHDHPSSKVSPAKEKKVQITDNVNQRKEEMVDGELRTSKDDTGGTQDLGNSGLSGVSDILGEMLLRGDMTRQQLGLSEKQAEHLREKARAATSLSQEELQKVFARKPSPDDKPQTEEQIKELHQWMAEKKKERLKQYKEQLNQLRAGEHHPYQPQESPRGKHHKGQTEKKQQSEEFMKKREEEASKLMGDILADLSAMPVTSSSPMTSRRGKETKVDTPRSERKVGKKAAKGISGKTVVRKIFRSSANNLCTGSPVRDQSAVDHMDLAVDGYMHLWADHMTSTRVIKPRDGQHSAAAAAAAQRDVVRSQSAPATPTQARKQKKLTDLVRLQRPEVTRQSHHVKRKPLTYTERLAQLQANGSTARTTSSAREQYKIYGSKHLPGSARLTQRKAPRVVKTYTERLAELRKQGERPSTADDTMSRLWSVQRRGISPRKPGKTLTYAERLQQLQPSKGTTRSSTGVVKPPAKPGYKWHKAPHKPKTYVEQLQELQKPATVRPTDMYKPKDYPSQSVGGVGRSRPYGDPYTETDDERLSMVSPWSVEEDVKRLLYEEDSIMERFSAVASDGDVSEMSEIQYYVGDEPEEYTDLVDVDQLAEIASVSEGSVMSFIDWDQVDKLIAEA